jgi:tetratricopeptide (TPR) repeat protein
MALDLSPDSAAGKAKGARHTRYLRICHEALALLDRAQAIYAQRHHQGGTGSVMVNAGHLHLDRGDIDRASLEAEKAYESGREKHDSILMARARILQSYIENARADEQLGDLSDVSAHANLAIQHAETGIALAKHTQNKRLLAGAYIARGVTAAADALQDWESAKQFASLADELLNSEDRDHLSKQLRVLKARILRSVRVDETLRLWSDGYTGNKTFVQITEEFAEIVIPKVWVREDRKISKVAEKLSMSPKKVRRILRKVQARG